jgi:hypothetical protein
LANTAKSWSDELVALVKRKPIVVLLLDVSEWHALRNARRGVRDFTTALPHADFAKVKAPTICLLLVQTTEERYAYLSLIGSRSAITTSQSRVKIKQAVPVRPVEPAALVAMMATPAHRRTLAHRLSKGAKLTVLSPELSGELLDCLANVEDNAGSMRALAAAFSTPRHFRSNAALQDDAIRTALKAFGLAADSWAEALELHPDRETGLARIPIIEDGAIEHDARSVPGFDLIKSDRTGRAVFARGNEQLEVYTANRRQLEEAFGVDLIYLNVTRRNVVMLQYKMLDPPTEGTADWTYRPDRQLDEELERMRRFARENCAPQNEYRFNAVVFYLKFVKRDGAVRQGGIIMPLDHFDLFVQSPQARGPRQGLRVGYNALGGSYMREQPFLDVIRAGYVGAYSNTTDLLAVLVKGVLERGRAVVAAIQTRKDEIPDDEI